MTLSPSFKHMLQSHTEDMPPRERAVRVASLCGKYKITNENDLREAALIANVKFEEVNWNVQFKDHV